MSWAAVCTTEGLFIITPQYFKTCIIIFVCSELSNSKSTELKELYIYCPEEPGEKFQNGLDGYTKQFAETESGKRVYF